MRMLVLDVSAEEVSVLGAFFGLAKSSGRVRLRLELSDFGTIWARDTEVCLSEQDEFEDVVEALMGRFGGLGEEVSPLLLSSVLRSGANNDADTR